MAEFNRKNKYSFWHSPLILVVLFCVLFLFVYNIIGLIEKERETAGRKEIILSKIEDLRNRETVLLRDIEKLKTEEGTEEAIRDKYQLAKAGEKIIIIVDEGKQNSEAGVPGTKRDYSFWNWVKRTLGLN